MKKGLRCYKWAAGKYLFVLMSLLTALITPSASAISPELQQLLHTGIEYYDPDGSSTQSGSCSADPTDLSGSYNEAKTWTFLKSQGLDDNHAAAVMGSLMQESHFDPTIIQGGGDSNDPAAAGSLGWGLAQWTPGAKVLNNAQEAGVTTPIYELGTQLQIIWYQMNNTSPTGYSHLLPDFTQISDLSGAVDFFRINFEGPDPAQAGPRLQYAEGVVQKYGGTGGCAGSPDCQTATDTTKILCEAKKYAGMPYEESGRGGHQGAANWHQACPTFDAANPAPGCVLDCSGLVNIAVYDAFGADINENTGGELAAIGTNWEEIPASEAKAGDIFNMVGGDTHHVEIVDHIVGGKIFAFGAHEPGVLAGPDQSYTTSSPYIKFLRYIGPGAPTAP